MGETKLEDILCHAEGNGALPAEGLLPDTDVMHVLHVLECFVCFIYNLAKASIQITVNVGIGEQCLCLSRMIM